MSDNGEKISGFEPGMRLSSSDVPRLGGRRWSPEVLELLEELFERETDTKRLFSALQPFWGGFEPKDPGLQREAIEALAARRVAEPASEQEARDNLFLLQLIYLIGGATEDEEVRRIGREILEKAGWWR